MDWLFRPFPLFSSQGLSGGFVMRIKPSGTVTWRRRLGGRGYDQSNDVASEGARMVLVVGSSGSNDTNEFGFSAVDLGGVGEARFGGATDAFLASFDAGSGAHLVSEMFGGDADSSAFSLIGGEKERALSIACDPTTGATAITGRFWAAVDFGGGDRLSSRGDSDAFLSVYRPQPLRCQR